MRVIYDENDIEYMILERSKAIISINMTILRTSIFIGDRIEVVYLGNKYKFEVFEVVYNESDNCKKIKLNYVKDGDK